MRGRPVSREDLLPIWLSEVLSSTFPSDGGYDFGYVNSTAAGEGQIRSYGQPAPEVVVKAVCKGCNNTWMSRLEGETKQFLAPMVRGEATQLDVSRQLTLARWAAKVAVLLEHYEAGSVILGPTDLEQIWRRGHAPLGFHLRLALRADEDLIPVDVYLANHVVASAPVGVQPSEDPPIANSFSVTLGLGRVAISVVGGPGVENPERWAKGSDRPLTIWPPALSGVINWPPSNPVLRSRADLRQFHESFWTAITNPDFPRPDALRSIMRSDHAK